MSQTSYIERIKVAGEELVAHVEQLVHEGNVRHIVIKQDEHTVAEFPLTIGVIGVGLAPIVAAIGALAAVITHCTIEVERISEGEAQTAESIAARKELDATIADEPVPPRSDASESKGLDPES